MYLYENKNNKIYIFELEPDFIKLMNYRIHEMKQYNDNILFVAEADAHTPNKILESDITEVNVNNLNIQNSPFIPFSGLVAYNNRFHSFRYDCENKEVMSAYYNGVYNDKKIIKVYKENLVAEPPEEARSILEQYNIALRGIGMEGTIKNKTILPSYKTVKQVIKYLIITNKYELQSLSKHIVMKNIIAVPKSLYLLQMLVQGNIHSISDENIDEQLRLFNLNLYPTKTILYEYLEDAIECGLIDDSIEKMQEKIEDSQKILKKIRNII